MSFAVVGLARGVSPEEALALLAPDGATPVVAPAAAREWAYQQIDPYGTALEAGRLGAWTLLYEHNGFRPQDEGCPERLSQRGEAVSIWRGAQGVTRFVYARAGRMIKASRRWSGWSSG